MKRYRCYFSYRADREIGWSPLRRVEPGSIAGDTWIHAYAFICIHAQLLCLCLFSAPSSIQSLTALAFIARRRSYLSPVRLCLCTGRPDTRLRRAHPRGLQILLIITPRPAPALGKLRLLPPTSRCPPVVLLLRTASPPPRRSCAPRSYQLRLAARAEAPPPNPTWFPSISKPLRSATKACTSTCALASHPSVPSAGSGPTACFTAAARGARCRAFLG